MMHNKKAMFPLLIVAAFILITGLLITTNVLNPGDIIGGVENGYFSIPHYATIKCEQSGTAKFYTNSLATDGQWLELPSNANQYDIKFKYGDTPLWSTIGYVEYYICPQKSISSNCQYQKGVSHSDVNVGAVSGSSYVWAQKIKTNAIGLGKYADDGASYTITYNPFVLLRYDSLRGGQQEVSGAIGCQVPSYDEGWANRVISAIGLSVPDGTAKTQILQPGERFNYISGSLLSVAAGNLDGNAYCIYSNGKATIYPIRSLTTGKATYNIVDTNIPSRTQECCSGDNLPDKTCVNGQWLSTATNECGLFNACEGSEWRRDFNADSQLIKYDCINNKCAVAIKQVECTKDSDCSSNFRCNTNSWVCEQASEITTEGVKSIPTDESTCRNKGYNWVPKTTTKIGTWPFNIFGSKTTVVEAHCEPPASIWKWIFYGVVIIIIGFVLIKLFPFIRHLLKAIPYVGKFVP